MEYDKLTDFGNPLTLQSALITRHEELEHKRNLINEDLRILERAIAYIREHEGLNKED